MEVRCTQSHGEGGSGHRCARSGSKVTGPAGEPGVQEGTYRGAMDWGTRTGLSTTWGSQGAATRRPQKSIQVARLLRPVPRSSEYHFPTFCQSSLDSGQEGLPSEGLAAPPRHPEREGPGFPAAVAPLLSWGRPPSQVAVEQGSPEAAQPPPAPHFTRRGLGALSRAVLIYHPAKWKAGGEEPGQGV